MTDDIPARWADDLALLNELADAAWSAIRPFFRSGTMAENKASTGFDPVTEADRAAERAIRAILTDRRPKDGINGEEFGVQAGQSGREWYVDPIDGTRAFIAGLPVWTTLIGLVVDGEPVLGMIDQPVIGERYLGWPGGTHARHASGETLALSVSSCEKLTEAVLATTDPFIMTPPEQGAFTHLRHTARITRYGLDAYAYARLAAGSVDMVTETGLQPHDVAALIPVVRGAGGLACDWRGNPARLGPQIVCAANQTLLDQALISLRRSAD